MAKPENPITEEIINDNINIFKAFHLQLTMKILNNLKDSTKNFFKPLISEMIKENNAIKDFNPDTGNFTIDANKSHSPEDFTILKNDNDENIKSIKKIENYLKSKVNIWILNFILNWILEMKTTKYQEVFATDINNLEEILGIKNLNQQVKKTDDLNSNIRKMASEIKNTLKYILKIVKEDKKNNNTTKLEFWKKKFSQFIIVKKIEPMFLWNFMIEGHNNVSFLKIDDNDLNIEAKKFRNSILLLKNKINENLPQTEELQMIIMKIFINHFNNKKNYDFMYIDIILNFNIINKQIEEWKLIASENKHKKYANLLIKNLDLSKDKIFNFINEQFINKTTSKIEKLNSENKTFSTTLDSFIQETEKTYSFVDLSSIDDLILQTSTIPELISNVSHQGIEIQQSIVLNQISQKQQEKNLNLEEEYTTPIKKQIKKKKKQLSKKTKANNTTQSKQETLDSKLCSISSKDQTNLTSNLESKIQQNTKPNPISQERNIAIPSTSKESKTHNASQKSQTPILLEQKVDEPQGIITKETEQLKKLKNKNKNLIDEITTLTKLVKETNESLQNAFHTNIQQCERNVTLNTQKEKLIQENKELTNQIQNSNAQIKEKCKLQKELKKKEILLKKITSKLKETEIENQKLKTENSNLQPAANLLSNYNLIPATCVTEHIQNFPSTCTYYVSEFSTNNSTVITPIEVTTDIPVVISVNIEPGVYLKPKDFSQWGNETLNLSNTTFQDETPNSNTSNNSLV